ncbi:MAG: hypothetical protein JWO99_402 [Candidatus Saccharibacteria bacterium]|nr:hypothetical protein [Candidatus Saccharibacteria bacterium]
MWGDGEIALPVAPLSPNRCLAPRLDLLLEHDLHCGNDANHGTALDQSDAVVAHEPRLGLAVEQRSIDACQTLGGHEVVLVDGSTDGHRLHAVSVDDRLRLRHDDEV